MKQPTFLPMTRAEMEALGWRALDVLIVTGDAYVDHPSFGAAVIGRVLVSRGYRTGILSQPDWKNPASITAMGRPRLFAGVTAGAMDSMVANYTANKKLRREDAYAPGGRHGLRPNRATLIYTNLIKHAFPGLPVVLGGIEASLRRLAHYDYWDDKLRRSLLLDAKADLLVYGMAERPVVEVAERLDRQAPLAGIPQTALVMGQPPEGALMLPSYEAIMAEPTRLGQAALAEERERNWKEGRVLAQPHAHRVVVVYPPAQPLGTAEMDGIYRLPFQRRAHPSYAEPVPALAPVADSIITHRGCFGGCSFCALGAHQGKLIQSRSPKGILDEIRQHARQRNFRGTITDVGGPSANMYGMRCRRPQGPCRQASCLHPEPCRHLECRPAEHARLLQDAAGIPGVKHVFVASGIRFDLALQDPDYVKALVRGGHVSGSLKVAPEHVSEPVLALMRKPGPRVFEAFVEHYRQACRVVGRPGMLNAYFIASFPGSTAADMDQVAGAARRLHLHVEQMQDFIPLPMTLAGVMYFTGRNPWNGAPLEVARTAAERGRQRRHLLAGSGQPSAAAARDFRKAPGGPRRLKPRARGRR